MPLPSPSEILLKGTGYAPGWLPEGWTGAKTLPISLGLAGALGGKFVGSLINKLRFSRSREEKKFFSNRLAQYGGLAGGLAGLGAIQAHSYTPKSETDSTPMGWEGVLHSTMPYKKADSSHVSPDAQTSFVETAPMSHNTPEFREKFASELARRGITPREVGRYVRSKLAGIPVPATIQPAVIPQAASVSPSSRVATRLRSRQASLNPTQTVGPAVGPVKTPVLSPSIKLAEVDWSTLAWMAAGIPLLTLPYYGGKMLATATTEDPSSLMDKIKNQELSAAYRRAITQLRVGKKKKQNEFGSKQPSFQPLPTV